VDSESGLLALFESAKEFEEAQRLEMETEKENTANAEAKLASLTAAAEENRKNAETKLAHLALEAESNKKKAPITAASLAEKRGLEKQVRRLVAERAELMATGAYSSADRVISLIDEKIAEMTNAVARG
jgi:centrosomal protein CEP120